MFHRSERLLLRPIWREDWQGIFRGIADEGVVRNLARAPWPYHEQHAREFAERPIDPTLPKFLVTQAANAEIVGCLGIDDTEAGVELGYWIARKHWGKGYATEAGRAALRVARALGHNRLIAAHFVDNPASGRVLRKIGFVPTGVVTKRHSLGRGEDCDTVEYAYEADAEGMVERKRAA
jgi:RimJ/RimL family protein N-acetyltransferase